MKHVVSFLSLCFLLTIVSITTMAEPIPLGPVTTTRVPLLNAIVAGGIHYFQINEQDYQALWRTDGTPEGTWLVHEVDRGSILNVSGGDTLLFYLSVEYHTGIDLYVIDANTRKPQYLISTQYDLPFGLVTSGDSCFWYYCKGEEGYLWTSDGTTEGTREIKRFQYPPQLPYNVEMLVKQANPIAAVPGGVVLGAPHPEAGIELWFSDGTEQGTILIGDLFQPPQGTEALSHYFSSIPSFVNHNGDNAYFQIAESSDNRSAFYRTDGTTKGTIPSSQPGAELNGDVFFMNLNGGLARAVNAGPEFSIQEAQRFHLGYFPDAVVAIDNDIYFVARTELGAELWRYNTMLSHLEPLADLNPGPADGAMLRIDPTNPNISHHNGFLYFYGNDGIYGWEIWRAGGYPFIIERMTDLNPGPGDINTPWDVFLPPMVVLGERLLFWGSDGKEGMGLWAINIRENDALENQINIPEENMNFNSVAYTGKFLRNRLKAGLDFFNKTIVVRLKNPEMAYLPR